MFNRKFTTFNFHTNYSRDSVHKKMKILNIYIVLFYSCLVYGQSKITLEGKWKITDLTIIEDYGRSWTKELSEIEEILGYQIEFTPSNTFKDSKEQLFESLNNLKWDILNNEENLVIGLKKNNNDDENHYEAIFEIINYNNKNVFLLSNNFVFELEKITTNNLGSTVLKELSIEKKTTWKKIDISKNTILELSDLDTIPKSGSCVNAINENALDCFKSIIKQSILSQINYSNVKGNLKIQIEFLINTNGETMNSNVSSESEMINQTIKNTILSLPKFEPGTKNGNNALVRYNLELNLISNQ